MKLYSNRLSPRILFTVFLLLFVILWKLYLDSLEFFYELNDIVDDGPFDSKNIFFIDVENIDAADTVKSLGIRQLCSIESAALANPKQSIFVVFITFKRHTKIKLKATRQLIALLSTYSNIKLVMLNYYKFVINTPIEEFIMSGKLRKSKYFYEHTSDVYRLLLLWKYGGTYLDTDVIVMKSLKYLGTNYACAQSSKTISNAILNFDLNYGYRLVENLMQEQIKHFNASLGEYNGPGVMKRILTKYCYTKSIPEMIRKETCHGFHVKSSKLCLPVPPEDSDYIFNETFTKYLLKIISNSITVHVYNAITWTNDVRINEKSLYVKLALRYCPAVFGSVDNDF